MLRYQLPRHARRPVTDAELRAIELEAVTLAEQFAREDGPSFPPALQLSCAFSDAAVSGETPLEILRRWAAHRAPTDEDTIKGWNREALAYCVWDDER